MKTQRLPVSPVSHWIPDDIPAPPSAPVLPEAKVLTTAGDIERIGGGGHVCRSSNTPLKNTCGCYCGRDYDKSWEVILKDGPRNSGIVCKCLPDTVLPKGQRLEKP